MIKKINKKIKMMKKKHVRGFIEKGKENLINFLAGMAIRRVLGGSVVGIAGAYVVGGLVGAAGAAAGEQIIGFASKSLGKVVTNAPLSNVAVEPRNPIEENTGRKIRYFTTDEKKEKKVL